MKKKIAYLPLSTIFIPKKKYYMFTKIMFFGSISQWLQLVEYEKHTLTKELSIKQSDRNYNSNFQITFADRHLKGTILKVKLPLEVGDEEFETISGVMKRFLLHLIDSAIEFGRLTFQHINGSENWHPHNT